MDFESKLLSMNKTTVYMVYAFFIVNKYINSVFFNSDQWLKLNKVDPSLTDSCRTSSFETLESRWPIPIEG